MKTLKKFMPLLLIICLFSSYIPAFAIITDDVLADIIIEDNLESYEAGYVPNGITGWGSNIDKPVTVQEIDGNKAIRYRNIGGYGEFVTDKGYSGKLWGTVSVLLPKDYNDFRIQFKNAETIAYPLCELHLIKTDDGEAKLRAMGIKKTNGTNYQPYICENIVTGEFSAPNNYVSKWVDLRVLFDTDSQTVKIFVNGTHQGEDSYDFCYKNYIENDYQDDTSLRQISFANRGLPEGITEADFYLDNFGIYYSRDLNTDTGYVERSEIVDIYDEYELPYFIRLPIENGQTRDVEITSWVPQGTEIDFSDKQEGSYIYHGYIDKSERYVKYNVNIKNRYIKEIPDVYESTYQFADYTLPDTVAAVMSDGNTKEIPVTWNDSIVDTSQTGVVEIEGVVDSTPNADITTDVTIRVGITVYDVQDIEDIYIGIPAGTENFVLPDRVTAKVSDGSKKQVAVIWDGQEPDTTTAGVYNYTGEVSGYFKRIKLQLTVYEKNSDDENILDALLEYYNHCLNEGRDRTRYGYSESDPNPIFAAGINRLTGEHSEWQFEEGNEPLTDLASQTVLLKGLMGMSQIIADEEELIDREGISPESYKNSVYDAYRYYFENFYDEKNSMFMWGGHMAVNMRTYEADHRLGIHELKDHYPLFDVMYEIDPERTERYIKALWVSHVKDTAKLQFSRHFNLINSIDRETIDGIFTTIQNNFEDPAPFFDAKDGLLTFITAANDFIYAAGELYSLNGDKDALLSAIDMQNMFLKGRHTGKHPITGEDTQKEGTGLIPFLFTESPIKHEPIYDVWSPESTNAGFGTDELKNRMQFNLYDLVYADPDYPDGNPYISDYGMNYDSSIDITIYCYNPMVMFRMSEKTDEETKRFLIEEAVETLAAFIKVKYDPSTNMGKPMLIDGTDLTGYVRKRTGYTGNIGVTFEPWILDADYILGFIRGYLNALNYEDEQMQENAEIIWSGARNIFEYYGVGDVGTAPGMDMELNFDTDCEEPFVLISLCELYNKVHVDEYLELARVVANNILNKRFSDGYFYESPDMLNANFNTEEPYALVYFIATTKGIAKNIPEHFGSRGFFQFDWWDELLQENRKLYSSKLWSLKTSSEVLATAIELNTNLVELAPGDKFTVSASIEPENTEDKTVEYATSDKNVCIVNEDGVITAVSPGEAQITATAVSGGCEATVKVKVR